MTLTQTDPTGYDELDEFELTGRLMELYQDCLLYTSVFILPVETLTREYAVQKSPPDPPRKCWTWHQGG